jgi:hypothetical protein
LITPEKGLSMPEVKMTGNSPSASSMSNSMNTTLQVQSKSSAVDVRGLNIYDFMMDTHDGTNGYRDGTYLIPHPKEAFYDTRRQSSFYKNYFRAIVSAMITPVFNNDPKREYEDRIVDAFIDDSDGSGTSLTQMIKEACTIARVCGVSFIVMDTPSYQPDTMADVLDKRLFPYIYLKRPQCVKDYVANDRGKITEITFYDKKVSDGRGSFTQYYRKWDALRWYLMYEKKGSDGKPVFIVEGEGLHGCGILPVISVTGFARTSSLYEFPDPPLFDLAGLTFSIYNRESEIRNMEQTQAFSTLYMQDGNQDVVLGTNNYLSVPMDAKITPGFISPDAAHLTNLVANCDKAREDLYRIAEQSGVVGVKSAESGISKQWDFIAHESVLKTTAYVAEQTEYKIIDLLGRYAREVFDYECDYPQEYSPNHSEERIRVALDALDRMPPEPVKNALWAEFCKTYWADMPEEAEMIVEALNSQPAAMVSEEEPVSEDTQPEVDPEPEISQDKIDDR